MAFWLVLQFPAASTEDYDAVVALEDELIEGLDDGSEVDGHDVGGGTMNVFIVTEDPRATFAAAKAIVDPSPLAAGMKAAFRDEDGDDFTPLWPEGLEHFEEL